MKTAIDWLLYSLPERYRNAMLNTCREEINQARQKEREQMIDFYTWMRRNDSAEEYFHYTDEDMLEQYLNGDYGPGWRDLSEPLEGRPQDTPAICEYSGLRPVEGYKGEETIDSILEIEEIEEEAAYRKGYMDGYDEGLYDGQYK